MTAPSTSGYKPCPEHSQGLQSGTKQDERRDKAVKENCCGLTAPDWAEMGSWAGRVGRDPKGGWAGQLNSSCTQPPETPVITGAGDAGGHKVAIGQLCTLAEDDQRHPGLYV